MFKKKKKKIIFINMAILNFFLFYFSFRLYFFFCFLLSIISALKKCKDGDFKCSVDGKCISYMQRCDFRNDCKDGEDETDCSKINIWCFCVVKQL